MMQAYLHHEKTVEDLIICN